MTPHWILRVLFIAAAACAANVRAPASSARIVGGTTTTAQQWPYVVQVETTSAGISWSQECGATIINNRYVLSAAQCFSGLLFSVSRRRLRAGSARRGSGGVVVGVSRVANHPDYNSRTHHADLTVVEQAAAWVYSTSIQSVPLVPQGFQLPDGLPVVIAGWGATRASGILGQSSSTLREVTLQTVNREVCAVRYENMTSDTVDGTMLCTGSEEGEMDACAGDEGGPVFYQDVNNDVFLVGVVSWRHSCGDQLLPSVNTQVSSYTNWIVINTLTRAS